MAEDLPPTRLPRRKQTAVYWAPTGNRDDGIATYAAPKEITVFWIDKRATYLTLNGEDATSRSVIYPEFPLEELGMILLGKLSDVEYKTEPSRNSGAWQIRYVEMIPDISTRRACYKAIV